MAKIYLNGETREVPDGTNLERLLAIFSMPSQRVAVEMNKTVVTRQRWDATEVREGDRIEIIHFVGGG
jgi:thiamine biosynthesis protein ThiS